LSENKILLVKKIAVPAYGFANVDSALIANVDLFYYRIIHFKMLGYRVNY